jgi:hypothetical protein
MLLNDELTAIFFRGVDSGHQTANEVKAELESELADRSGLRR